MDSVPLELATMDQISEELTRRNFGFVLFFADNNRVCELGAPAELVANLGLGNENSRDLYDLIRDFLIERNSR